MALTTLATSKAHLGIADSNSDSALTQWIGAASAAIRRYVDEYLYGAIGGATASSPAVIISPQHGLESGQTILISGSATTPTLDGQRVVSVTSPDTFTVPVAVTVADTIGRGIFCRSYIEFYSGNGMKELALGHMPVQSVTNVWLDGGAYFGDAPDSFGPTTLLVCGTDYALLRDDAGESDQSHSGLLVRIGGNVWPRPANKTLGLLVRSKSSSLGNIKVQYIAGYSRLLGDVELACNQLVAQLRRSAGDGGPLVKESYDNYSYERVAADLEAGMIGSVRQLLKRYKRWSF